MRSPSPRAVRRIAAALAGVAGLVLLLLWMQGVFRSGKVRPGESPLPGSAPPRDTAVVVRREIEEWQEWPGTIASRMVAQVSPRITARVLEIKVAAGAKVSARDVVAVLDDRDLKSRVDQARSAVTAAEAQARESASDLERTKGLFEKGAASRRELEAAEARAGTQAAQAAQARDALTEAEVMLGEAVLRAPFDGVVAERLAEPGDLAVPGRAVVTVHDPVHLRLEAQIPESCAAKAHVGMEVPVFVEALSRDLQASVEEISPMADPVSRTFLVKAALPSDAALRPGMFGRFRTACTKREALLVPAAAVRRIGQLESVEVVADGVVRQRNIRTGKAFGADVEVLSGLEAGERVVVPAK
ncbi:MAG: efflux RND transporter periplasmic adaptor subunit [Planctomycetia bacterium]|nr:efflux RND transporter periplasmic adaptor subunit [Planctomycetia bacterium]